MFMPPVVGYGYFLESPLVDKFVVKFDACCFFNEKD